MTQVEQTPRLRATSAQDWSWQEQAACAGQDPRLFGAGGDHEQPTRRQRSAAAQALCGPCPVREACLASARAQEGGAHGLWGGRWFGARGYETDAAAPAAAPEDPSRNPRPARPAPLPYDAERLARLSPPERVHYLRSLGWPPVAISDAASVPVRTVRRWIAA